MAAVKDPVCGMEIEESAAFASEEQGGKKYYFCSLACHEEFKAKPDHYAK